MFRAPDRTEKARVRQELHAAIKAAAIPGARYVWLSLAGMNPAAEHQEAKATLGYAALRHWVTAQQFPRDCTSRADKELARQALNTQHDYCVATRHTQSWAGDVFAAGMEISRTLHTHFVLDLDMCCSCRSVELKMRGMVRAFADSHAQQILLRLNLTQRPYTDAECETYLDTTLPETWKRYGFSVCPLNGERYYDSAVMHTRLWEITRP